MITAMQNPRIQRVRGLLEKRKEREAQNACVLEGVRLVEDALAAGWLPELVLFDATVSARGTALVAELRSMGCVVEEAAPELMRRVATTETPQGLLAVVPLPMVPLPPPCVANFVIILDEIRDPGNVGTILRTAQAAGVQAALLSPGTADVFSPKVLRAGMGAQFRLPAHRLEWEGMRRLFAPHLRFLLADMDGSQPCWEADLRQPLALIIGGEADGASAAARQAADESIRIPMPGLAESLNAAVAAGILLFEVVRQRQP